MSDHIASALQRRMRDPLFAVRYFVGDGIDIGAGQAPLWNQRGDWWLMRSCRAWDLVDGDAQLMEGVAPESFDFVYSSHCLEHLVDPAAALARWWAILKPGGHLVLLVPDEDLYEQGQWPSTFNSDHKHTFTIAKRVSWSPVSRNVGYLLMVLDGEILKMERIEEGYRCDAGRVDQTPLGAESCIECVVRKPRSG